MISKVLSKLRRAAARIFAADVRELERQLEYMSALARKDFESIKLVHFEGNELRMEFQNGFGGMLAEWMAQMFDAAPAENYIQIAASHPRKGNMMFTLQRLEGEMPAVQVEQLRRELDKLKQIARPISEYHEDMGTVLWWKFPIIEPPYVGTPNDLGVTIGVRSEICDWRGETIHDGQFSTLTVGGWPGDYTHWTPIIVPDAPDALQEAA